MKRTPFNRAGNLRRASKTNSKPWQNLPLLNQYKLDNPIDELAKYFPMRCSGESKVPKPSANENPENEIIFRYDEPATECHHILGGISGCRRWDVVTHLIHLSRHTHAFCERYLVDGVVLCIRAKLDKGEWDWDEIDRIMKPFNVRGWLQTKDVQFSFVKPILATLFGT